MTRVLLISLSIALLAVQISEAEVFDISAIINTAQENPAPTGVSASTGGFATVQYDDVSKELAWNIAWQDLTGPAEQMHFHAPAPAGANASSVVNIGDVSGLTSPSIGSTTVTDEFAGNLLNGLSYINIHTAANGPGEIRGQVSPQNTNLFATLDTSQEIPAPAGVPASAGGIGKNCLRSRHEHAWLEYRVARPVGTRHRNALPRARRIWRHRRCQVEHRGHQRIDESLDWLSRD